MLKEEMIQMNSLLTKFTFTDELTDVIENCKGVVVPTSKAELYDMVFGPEHASIHILLFYLNRLTDCILYVHVNGQMPFPLPLFHCFYSSPFITVSYYSVFLRKVSTTGRRFCVDYSGEIISICGIRAAPPYINEIV